MNSYSGVKQMKFLKALGIGFLADIFAMLISLIIIIACLALKASWLSLIISFFAVPALIIALYFHYRKKAESKAYYWLSRAFLPLAIHFTAMVGTYHYCRSEYNNAIVKKARFAGMEYLLFWAMAIVLFHLLAAAFFTGLYEFLDAVIKDRNKGE